MRFRIHRAASQIGGNCIEVHAGGKSILLDLGLPLGAAKAAPAFLPAVPGIASGDTGGLLGVVLSHPHQDHYGLLACANPDIPVYLGEGAERLLEGAAFFTAGARIPQRTITYRGSRRFQVGPFSITPLLVDHSAYDAYALLVEADGRRLLYSGDFRCHGRKGSLMESMMRHPPSNIDVLLMEGTVLGREDADAPMSEDLLESNILGSLTQCKGLALAYFSAQNIDRLITFYRATVRAGRTFVIDVYTAHILDRLERKTLPSPRWSDIRVFLPKRQKLQIVRAKRFDLVEPYRSQRLFASQIAANPKRWVVLFRSSMAADFEAMNCLPGSKLLYSLWPGYLKRDNEDVREWAAAHGMQFEIQHTSGHAYVRDLLRFAECMAPKRLVPIHTRHPEQYKKLFRNVRVVANGIWADV